MPDPGPVKPKGEQAVGEAARQAQPGRVRDAPEVDPERAERAREEAEEERIEDEAEKGKA